VNELTGGLSKTLWGGKEKRGSQDVNAKKRKKKLGLWGEKKISVRENLIKRMMRKWTNMGG